MSLISDDVSKWIARELADITEDGRVSRIELHHTIEGEGSEKLRTYRNLSDMTVESLTDDVWGTAEKDSGTRAHDMPQRYALLSFRDGDDDSDGAPESMHAFVLKGSMLATILGSSTDPPTTAGRMSQEMRHSEQLHRMLVGLAGETAGRLSREIDRETKLRHAAEERVARMVEREEASIQREHERSLERAKAAQSARHTDQLVNTVLSLGTLMAAKYLGTGSLPAPPGESSSGPPTAPPALGGSQRSAVLGAFLGSLSQEEAMGMFAALKAQNKLVVQELHKSYQEFPPGSNTFVDAGRDLSIAKFMQGLDRDEVTGIISCLSSKNLEIFKAIYASYRDSYEEEQRQTPAPLRDDPN